MPITFDAVVLAAGRSTRMGSDKALLTAPAGGAMWERQRDVLAASGAASVFLSARPEQRWSRDARGFAGVLHDALTGCGPIVGITAALERSARGHVAALAIDLPQMTPEWFQRLALESAAGVGAVGRREGFYEPLAAIYPREMMFLAWEALGRGDYALQALLKRAVEEGLMRAIEIGPAEAALFTNRNEPDARAES